ncbi:hypothetical protein PCANC_23492 [Puccinia coronata f. sp. avenae]|uniref:Uncharacterized protein n=1 Tax=Puccinia coronata f. sp. avenae TaxID=200324 RepID=A0A2N5TT81_9BASI|nr:hypothetical protein PCASD_26663 [Puccinia coronata f. sp. avenae]PLW28694.1 hypothetical protein PCANC_23492 [Puccinia coronata f. sp. avenae]PLW45487.1 hypothetical protein PCASD_05967 [Puccinia coronata f. sp. avenae]
MTTSIHRTESSVAQRSTQRVQFSPLCGLSPAWVNWAFLLHVLIFIHVVSGAISNTKALPDIVALGRIPPRWKAFDQSEQTSGFGKRFLDEKGQLEFFYNQQVYLTARLAPVTKGTRSTSGDVEQNTDQLGQIQLNPTPSFPQTVLEISTPIRGSIVTLSIVDLKNKIHIKDQKIPGKSSVETYELAEGYEPSQLLFSVDGIADHGYKKNQKPKPIRPALPPQSRVLGSDTNDHFINRFDNIVAPPEGPALLSSSITPVLITVSAISSTA